MEWNQKKYKYYTKYPGLFVCLGVLGVTGVEGEGPSRSFTQELAAFHFDWVWVQGVGLLIVTRLNLQ